MFTLFNDDCFNIFPTIATKSINLICTDLPYGTTLCKWDTPVNLPLLWDQFKRIITDDGVIVLHCAQPFTSVLGSSNLPWLKESLVWEKSRATGFLQSKKRHLKIHEDILVFSPGAIASGSQVKINMTYNPQNLIKLLVPIKSRNSNKNYLGTYSTNYSGIKQTHTNYPKSVLKFSSQAKPVHPTQKPVPLLEYLIKTYSNEGDIVLDCCAGSGSTGVACVTNDRNFIGIEKDLNFYNIMKERI